MVDQGLVKPIAASLTLRRVSIYAGAMGLYAGFAVLKEYSSYRELADIPAELHAALTLVLGWLLVFRTNTAYSRWWEARTLWGKLVNVSRNLAVKIVNLVDSDPTDRDLFRAGIIGFPLCLCHHLRSEPDLRRIPGFEDCKEEVTHVPVFLASRLYRGIQKMQANGKVDSVQAAMLDTELRSFLDVCGGCERIRTTRIARSYRIFARQCVFLFLFTFPWGIVNDFGSWTIPLTIIISYFMIGLETVAEHVEEPFGTDEDDLDIEALCETVEKTVTEIFDRGKRETVGS